MVYRDVLVYRDVVVYGEIVIYGDVVVKGIFWCRGNPKQMKKSMVLMITFYNIGGDTKQLLGSWDAFYFCVF